MRVPNIKQVFFGTVSAIAIIPMISNLPANLEEDKPFKFPDEKILNPAGAPEYTKRAINPLWAPTSYLQGIDCEQKGYELKDLNGQYINFKEYEIDNQNIIDAAEETSLGYSVYVSEDGHAILNLKAIGKPGETNKHEQADGIIRDLDAESQFPVLDQIVDHLINNPEIITIETIGFAQGSAGVYHLAEHHGIIGTNVSDTGTDYTSTHLQDSVISLDVPGDIHSLTPIGSTGKNKPAHVISLSSAHNDWSWEQSYTPVETSWVEKIQTLAFKYPEAEAPEGYEDHGIKLANPDGVCDNSTMVHD